MGAVEDLELKTRGGSGGLLLRSGVLEALAKRLSLDAIVVHGGLRCGVARGGGFGKME